jgi:hypothetical protein
MQDTVKDARQVKMPRARTAVDRRRELRLPCDRSTVLIELPGKAEQLQGEIIDVSRSGIFVRLDSQLNGGDSLRAILPHMTISGKVRYSRPNAQNSFDTGIEILDVEYTGEAV